MSKSSVAHTNRKPRILLNTYPQTYHVAQIVANVISVITGLVVAVMVHAPAIELHAAAGMATILCLLIAFHLILDTVRFISLKRQRRNGDD